MTVTDSFCPTERMMRAACSFWIVLVAVVGAAAFPMFQTAVADEAANAQRLPELSGIRQGLCVLLARGSGQTTDSPAEFLGASR